MKQKLKSKEEMCVRRGNWKAGKTGNNFMEMHNLPENPKKEGCTLSVPQLDI